MALRNWSGNIIFSTDTLVQPKTVEDLQDAVADTPRMRVLGTGHSFSRVADTDGVLVNLAELDLPIDVGDTTVTVPGGVRYGELTVALERRGLALHNLGSLPHISVAGACATGTHGSGDTNRCLAAAAVAVEFVAADGSLHQVRRGDPEFGGSVLALGSLGVVTRVTLALEPSYEMRQDLWLDAPLDIVAERLDEVLAAGYSVSVFTDFRRPRIIDKVWIKSRTEDPPADGTPWGAQRAAAPPTPDRRRGPGVGDRTARRAGPLARAAAALPAGVHTQQRRRAAVGVPHPA